MLAVSISLMRKKHRWSYFAFKRTRIVEIVTCSGVRSGWGERGDDPGHPRSGGIQRV